MKVWLISDPKDNVVILTVNPKVIEQAQSYKHPLDVQEFDFAKEHTVIISLDGGPVEDTFT